MDLTPQSAFAVQAAPSKKPPSIRSPQRRLPSTSLMASILGKTSRPPNLILHKTLRRSVSKHGTAPSPQMGFPLLSMAMESNSATPCSVVIQFQQLMENQSAFPLKTLTSPFILSQQGSSQPVSNSMELPPCKPPVGVRTCTGLRLSLRQTAQRPFVISNLKTPKQPHLMHSGMVTFCTVAQQPQPSPLPPQTSSMRRL